MFLAYECYREASGTGKKVARQKPGKTYQILFRMSNRFYLGHNLWKTDKMEKLFAGEYSCQQRWSSKSLFSLSALPVKTAAKALQVVHMDAAKVSNFLS